MTYNPDVNSYLCFWHFKTLMLAQSLGKETFMKTMLLYYILYLSKLSLSYTISKETKACILKQRISKSPAFQIKVGNLQQFLYTGAQS